jgi:hypothetical protein
MDQRREGIIAIRKAILLLGVFLALAALSPTWALAKAGGTYRPFRSRDIGGIGTFNTNTGTFSADATELLSHFGRARSHNVGTFAVTGPGTFTSTFNVTEVAPNGDELTLVVSETGTFTAERSDAMFVATITGGTGRFADATGGTTGTTHTRTISSNGGIFVARTTSEGRGHISY